MAGSGGLKLTLNGADLEAFVDGFVTTRMETHRVAERPRFGGRGDFQVNGFVPMG